MTPVEKGGQSRIGGCIVTDHTHAMRGLWRLRSDSLRRPRYRSPMPEPAPHRDILRRSSASQAAAGPLICHGRRSASTGTYIFWATGHFWWYIASPWYCGRPRQRPIPEVAGGQALKAGTPHLMAIARSAGFTVRICDCVLLSGTSVLLPGHVKGTCRTVEHARRSASTAGDGIGSSYAVAASGCQEAASRQRVREAHI